MKEVEVEEKKPFRKQVQKTIYFLLFTKRVMLRISLDVSLLLLPPAAPDRDESRAPVGPEPLC